MMSNPFESDERERRRLVAFSAVASLGMLIFFILSLLWEQRVAYDGWGECRDRLDRCACVCGSE